MDHGEGGYAKRARAVPVSGHTADRGHPLDAGDRALFTPRLGADLSGVRLRDGPAAAVVAEQLRARAFTVGQDIYLGAAAAQAARPDARPLLVHELRT
jgi:hypothetical protein